MNTIKIPFRGITRNTDDGICQDGDCMELINAHVVNGSIEPVSKPIELAAFSKKNKEIHFHTAAKKYIIITDSGKMQWTNENFSTGGELSGPGPVRSVSFIGNTIAVFTDDGIRYFLHKNNSYYYLGNLPELPEVRITKSFNAKIVKSEVDLSYTRGVTEEQQKKFFEAAYGYWLKALKQLNKSGFFAHCTCIRMAFRMFDGSYIMHSPIRCLSLFENDTYKSQIPGLRTGTEMQFSGGVGEYSFFCEKSDTASPQPFWFGVMGMRPEFECTDFDLSTWSDVIIGIDIFASQSFRFKMTQCDLDEEPAVAESVSKASNFYKIASIDLNGNISFPKSDVSSDYIALNHKLTDDYSTRSKTIALRSYVYNNRIHLWGLSTTVFEGYLKDWIYDTSTQKIGTGNLEVCTFLKINGTEAIARKYFQSIQIPEFFPPFLMYPDYRAYKIVINITNLDQKSYSKEFPLTKHSILNAAYYINTLIKGEAHGLDFYHSEDVEPQIVSKWNNTTIPVTGGLFPEVDNAKLKVSELNNPFVFPPRNTYQFQTDVIAVQSNTVAISQGQFGQHPLYVFCKHGIFAMSVGTGGDVTYTTSTPVSRDVANSPHVAGIDSAVAFLSDRGALLISGAQVQKFSEPLDGFLPSCVLSSPVIPKVMAVAGMEDMFSSVVFRDYCNGAKVGYNYQQSEVIIANAKYPYAYAYSMKSTSWHKISLKIHFFINAYPNTYVFASKGDAYAIYDLNNNHRSVATMVLISRPIKLGTNTHKRILQSALRGIVKRAMSDLYLRGEPVMFRSKELSIFSDVGFYILGSNDAEHFMLVSGKESITDIRDLVTKMTKSKAYKYFMVCLVGGVRSDVSINYIEAIADESYDNRLR